MISLQTTIIFLLCILSIPWLLPASHLISCLNVNARLTCTSRNATHYSSITCRQEPKPVIQLNELTCRLWKVCWGPGALCLWTPSRPGHPRFPWWHWSSSSSQTANIQSVNIWRRKMAICCWLGQWRKSINLTKMPPALQYESYLGCFLPSLRSAC